MVAMMMGIDQARQNDVAGGVKNHIRGCSRLFPARHNFRDLAVANDDATACPSGQNGQRILYPGGIQDFLTLPSGDFQASLKFKPVGQTHFANMDA